MVRFKNRYLLVEVEFSDSQDGRALSEPLQVVAAERVSARSLFHAIRAGVERHFGDIGAASAAQSLAVKYFAPKLRLAIVRCPRDAQTVVAAAIALVSNLREARTLFARCSVVHTGGTIRSTQQAAIKRAKKRITREAHQELLAVTA